MRSIKQEPHLQGKKKKKEKKKKQLIGPCRSTARVTYKDAWTL